MSATVAFLLLRGVFGVLPMMFLGSAFDTFFFYFFTIFFTFSVSIPMCVKRDNGGYFLAICRLYFLFCSIQFNFKVE